MELPPPVQQFIDDESHQEDVLGVALFGSWARGDNRPDSDIDLFILTTDREQRAIEKIDTFNIEMIYTSEERARKFAFKRMDPFLNMWRDAKILFDKDGGLQHLKEFAIQTEAAGKPPLQSWEIVHKQFDIEDAIKAARALSTTDTATAEMFLQRTIYNFLQFYFDKNQIWAPPPKQQLEWLREHSPELASKFEAFYTAPAMEGKLKWAEALCASVIPVLCIE